METQAVGIGHHAVGSAMNDTGMTLVAGSCLVDGQPEGRVDVVASEAVAPDFHVLGRIQRVTLEGRLSGHGAADGIVAQHAGRRQQHHAALQRLLAQLAGQHRCDHAAL